MCHVLDTSFYYALVNEGMLCNDVFDCDRNEWNEAPLHFLVSMILYCDDVLCFSSLYIVLHDNLIFI